MSVASLLAGTPAVLSVESSKAFTLFIPGLTINPFVAPGPNTTVWDFGAATSTPVFPVGSQVIVQLRSATVFLQATLTVLSATSISPLLSALSSDSSTTGYTLAAAGSVLQVVAGATAAGTAMDVVLTLATQTTVSNA